MKMSDVFDLPLQLAVNELAIVDKNDCVVGWADAFSGQAARDCFVDAANNHDRMADEIAELREALGNVILDCEKVIINLTNTGCDEAWSIIKLNNIIDDCKLPLSSTCQGCDGECEITDTFDVVWPCPECHGSGKMLNK